MSLELYHFEACPYCAKVRSAARELAVDVRMKDIREKGEYRDELIAMNGRPQVPCLVVDGTPMLESDAIISYLKENYG